MAQQKQKEYGVVIGPTTPGDISVFKQVIGKVDGVREKECTVHTFPDYNFISVQLPSYEAMKEFVQKQNSSIFIAMVDFSNFESLANRVWADFPNIIKGSSVNFSCASSKYIFNPRYAPNIGTLLFLTAMYAAKNGLLIDSFNFTNCNINKPNGFHDCLSYFPSLKEINLSGNSLNLRETAVYFGNAKILTDNPVIEIEQDTVIETPEEDLPESANSFFLEQPHLVFQSLYKKSQLSIDMFPIINIDPHESPLNNFLVSFFRDFSNPITEDALAYYFPNAVFSVCTSKSPQVSPYAEVNSDLSAGKPIHVIGNAQILSALNQLFPNGLKSRVSNVHGSVHNQKMFFVVIHGVFISCNDSVLGFDRSLLISYCNYNLTIMNDNLFIREPPTISE